MTQEYDDVGEEPPRDSYPCGRNVDFEDGVPPAGVNYVWCNCVPGWHLVRSED